MFHFGVHFEELPVIAFENHLKTRRLLCRSGFDVPGRGFYWHQAGKTEKRARKNMVAVLISRLQKMVSQRSLENKHDGEVFILFKIHSYLYVIFLEYKQTVSKYLYIHIILSYKFYSCIIFSILHHMMNFSNSLR